MNEEKEAVVFIPGFAANTKNHYLDNFLITGLTTRLEQKRILLAPDEVKVAGQSGRRFMYEMENYRKIIDIYEVFWSDLVDPLSRKDIKKKIIGGISLFIFWISKSISIARKSRIFSLQIVVFMSLVIFWYYGTLVMLLTAIGNDPTVLGTQLPDGWASTLGQIGNNLGGWSIWVATSLLISFLSFSVDSIVDLIDFTARYMRDETSQKLGGLRDRLRRRVSTALDDVIQSNEYQKITVLSHSFGTLISTDLLADYYHPDCQSIRYITLGSPLASLTSHSKWLKSEVVRCLENNVVTTWVDFYSNQDWFCTQVPRLPSKNLDKLKSHSIGLKVSFFDQVLGASHNAYFFEKLVLEEILDR